MDATCLPRARMQDVVPDLLGSGFFAFTFRHGRLGNWFLASEPNHYVVAMLREAHYAYWRAYDHVVDYYLFHHLFEMLYLLDERFAASGTPRRAASSAAPRPTTRACSSRTTTSARARCSTAASCTS